MKYAIQGLKGAIKRITEQEPRYVEVNDSVVELTDEQAVQVNAGKEAYPKKLYSLYNGELITLQERYEIDRIAALSLEEYKEEKKSEFEAARYQEEVSGIEVNGISILTDRPTQSKLSSAYVKALNDSSLTLNWKTTNGFVTLDAPTLIALGDAVFAHVQYCFDKEKSLIEQIDAATSVEEVKAIQWE